MVLFRWLKNNFLLTPPKTSNVSDWSLQIPALRRETENSQSETFNWNFILSIELSDKKCVQAAQ